MKQEIFVTEELAGDRIDKFISEQCEELSRSFIQKLLKSGEIYVGQKAVKVRVLDIQDTTKKDEAKDLFEYVS